MPASTGAERMATEVNVTAPESNVFLQEIVPFTLDGNLDLLMLWSLAIGGSSVPLQVLQYNPSSNSFSDVTSSIFAGSVPGANNPRNVTIADLNHDGNPDIVIANPGLDQSPFPGSTDTLLLSTPSGQLANASVNLPQTLAYAHDVSSGIIDSAGDVGVFVNNIFSQARTAPYYLVSNGNGTFTNKSASFLPQSLHSTFPAYTSSALVDLNGDGVADLVLGAEDLTDGPSEVYLNPGNGNFSAAKPIVLPAPPLPATTGLFSSTPSGPSVLDIEPIHISSSKYNDLVVVSTTGDYEGFAVQILINDGSGHFTDETASRLLGAPTAGVFPAGSGLGGLTWDIHAFVDDLNGDGRPDIITEGRSLPSEVFLNDGSGHFNLAYSLPYTIGWQINAVATIAGTPTLIESDFTSVQLVPFQPPPRIVNPITNQTVLEGKLFSYKVPADTFVDPSGEQLTYTASGPNGAALPAWLSFDASTMTLSGTSPDTGQIYPVTITATDTNGWLTEDNFTVTSERKRFNAGGNSSDIVWQNTNTGQASIWDMSGSSVIGGGPVSPNPGPSWTEVGTGDFNDDGHSDILWQNTSGQGSVWEMNGSTLIGGGPAGPNPGPSWTEIGTGDFNDDAHSDILWQNTNTGQASIWDMSGNALIGGGPVSPNPGPAWKAIGTGDFNDDHHSDILWQNTSTGQVSIWEMSGTKIIGGGPLSANPGPSWQAMGTGDFNGDGRSDILWRNTSTGQVSIWEMSGTDVIGGGPIASNPGLSWSAVGTGDFNHDGQSDILWQNANGQVSIWEMNGAKVIGGGPVASNPGPSWLAL
jgi:Putative Ig domain/FG-GAP-like repeat